MAGDIKDMSILVIDDEEANIALLEALLDEEGYTRVTSTRDPRRAIDLYREVSPDLILLDLHMPYIDGFGVVQAIREIVSDEGFVPIIVLTADVTAETRNRALREGAKDFINKPLDPLEVMLRVRNLLETRLHYREQREARASAEAGERRASFLAEASRVLASTFDFRAGLAVLAERAVPAIADFCMVELTDPDGDWETVAIAHVDPVVRARLEELEQNTHGDWLRLAIGEAPLMVQEVTGHDPVVAHGDRRIWDVVQPRSLIRVPLGPHPGVPLGALTLARADASARYDREDLALAEEIGVRAGLAVENALLYEEAQTAMQIRDELLAVVAHDLRNPLNTIAMVSGLLMERGPDETARKHLQIVARAASRMNRLIQDLLEVTRLDRGKLKMEFQRQDIAMLLNEAATSLAPLASAKKLQLIVEPYGELPPVMVDGARILQVISNLVGNAIKFTPESGWIRIGCEHRDGEVRLSVSDNGPGIAPDQIPHIFRRFWQASDADARGVGLGLSIAHGIIEAHGGKIWVESAVGQGTTFYASLPVHTDQTVHREPGSPILPRLRHARSISRRRGQAPDPSPSAGTDLRE